MVNAIEIMIFTAVQDALTAAERPGQAKEKGAAECGAFGGLAVKGGAYPAAAVIGMSVVSSTGSRRT